MDDKKENEIEDCISQGVFALQCWQDFILICWQVLISHTKDSLVIP